MSAAKIQREKVSAQAWCTVWLLFVFYTLSIVDRTILSMLVVPIQRDLHLTDFEMSLLLGPAFIVCYSLAGLPLGWMADRYSRRGLVGLGTAGWSLATAASGLVSSFPGFIASRISVGVGEAALTPAAYSLIAAKFPRARLATAMAIYGTAPKLGLSVAFSLGAALISITEGLGPTALPGIGPLAPWQLTFLVLGVAGVLLSILALTISEPSREIALSKGADGAGGTIPFFVKRRRSLVPVLIGFGLVSLASNALLNWTPTYMQRQFGWEPAQYGPALSLISLVMAGTIVFKGMLVDWLFARGMTDAHVRFFTWLLLLATPVLLLGFLLGSPGPFIICYAIANIAALTFLAYLSSIIQLITPPELRGRVTAVSLLVLSILGGGLGPVLVAGLSDYVLGGPQALGHALAIVSVAGLTSGFVVLRLCLAPLREAVEEEADFKRADHP